jgi:AcrR family transcriptional regulator
MKGMKEEEELEDEDLISEEETEEIESVISEEEEVEEEETEEEEVVEEEYDLDEDVNALLGGEDLSEEFREKAKTIFEAAINSKVNEIKEALEVQYEERLTEEVQEIAEALSERVDSYLEYVSDEWFQENALAVEAGLKEELTESFMTGLKGLFEEHYVSIPEDKYDVLESMVEKLDEMETKLNEQIEKNVSLNKRLAESVADGIFDEISEGLAATQKEKLASLAESVEFESEEEYREKLETLKESYFPSRVTSPSAKTETLSEGVDNSPEFVSGSMATYLKTLSSFSK